VIRIKRAYEKPAPDDGVRVLVDRLWPRGVRKSDAAIERWDAGVAPSPDLRRFFGHDPARWEEFRRRYLDELREPSRRTIVEELAKLAAKGTVTLVYGARDEAHNHAIILRDVMNRIAARKAKSSRRKAWN
jgi:uncharacterized protein YeaO (DUF488 family)